MAAGDVFLVVVLIIFPPLVTIGVCCWLAHRCSRRPKVIITNKIYPAQYDDSGRDSDDYRQSRRRKNDDNDSDRDAEDNRQSRRRKNDDNDPDGDSDDDWEPPRRSGRRG